ncbi:hypothetical protein Prudu_000099 [Prunus dulcis]|uniref:Dymeclin n=1 Tax=Prunus dulcis TaxID=3755 RepID=A0A4Y1QKT9_PRUDU|nr:hypothetical protein Prudu_000099 [Prunus dulcis]
MGAVPSTPRWGGSSSAARPLDTAEYLISTFIGDESFPISSDFWHKLLELPLNLQWPPHRVHDACQALARNNYHTRHLAKILIHMAWCLQESISTSSGAPSLVYVKAVNAVYISSVFLKYFIENEKGDKIEDLYLSLDESEPIPTDITKDLNIEEFVMRSVLSFIGSIDVSPDTYLLHLELLNFMLIAMSTQLLSGPSPGPEDVNPFIDAAMSQEVSLVFYKEYLADEAAALLLYSLLQGNADFLEYVLVRTDLDTLIVPSVPWYKERLLHQTSLGSLMVITLIRTVQYNLSKLRDVYLHTTCLATLANMAPHVHRLSAYASQRLVSLFDMLSRKYNKLAEMRDNQMQLVKGNSIEGNGLADDTSTEMHIYTDFLRLVLEILNAILTYALPRNPEVLDFFNSRMDAHNVDGEWSVEKVLQVIIINCRSWRGEGMKMFTQLRFTYEQESHPEEFFIPYLWQLVLSRCGLGFNPDAINLFPVDPPSEKQSDYEVSSNGHVNGESTKHAVFVEP